MTEYESSTEGEAPEQPTRRSKLPRWLQSRKNRWIASSALVVALVGSSVGIATSSATTTTPTTTSAASARSGHAYGKGYGSGSGSSPARTTSAQGGTTGTINTVSASSFTLTTPAAQKVTVNESSSTTYEDGTTSSTAASVVQTGQAVLVFGTVDSTTIAASEISLQPTSTTAPATAATVVPFTQGKPSAEKNVGTIPADWSAGQGTLVSGAAANEATAAALAAYPGGVVDRVVVLSDGDYNVHFIGVNWPHHVFLNSSFKVIGAE
jgi:hypothetical protein